MNEKLSVNPKAIDINNQRVYKTKNVTADLYITVTIMMKTLVFIGAGISEKKVQIIQFKLYSFWIFVKWHVFLELFVLYFPS